jgi:hypothetical protein
MAEVIRMPLLSDTMTEGKIIAWNKQVGDKVKADDVLADVETDKATMEVVGYTDGTLLYIGVKDGESAKINDAFRRFYSLPPKAWLDGFTGLVYRVARLAPEPGDRPALIGGTGFPAFIIIVVWIFRRDSLSALALGGFFVGSANWFFAAKGHSYIHYQLNYVLWYLLFVPVAVLLGCERLKVSVEAGVSLFRKKNFYP